MAKDLYLKNKDEDVLKINLSTGECRIYVDSDKVPIDLQSSIRDTSQIQNPKIKAITAGRNLTVFSSFLKTALLL